MRTIGVVTTSRADYAGTYSILNAIQADPELRLAAIVSGSHLSPERGLTVEVIERDGFEISERIEVLLASDSAEGTAKAMALGLLGFAQTFSRSRPDVLVVLGDRFEMHAAALAALPFRIPVAHVHGGEVTEGAIDDALRHSISKLSHLHFVSTAEHGRRVCQLGEEPWRVTVSGAPSLDNLRRLVPPGRTEVESRFGLRPGEEFLLVTFHPATLDPGDPGEQARMLLSAVERTGLPAVVTMPNVDPGNEAVRNAIRERTAKSRRLQAVESLGTETYFGMMAWASAMVGNSSSGVIEAASFGLPVVDVGSRQRGRTAGGNVIRVEADEDAISLAIRRALDPSFRAVARTLENPYGDGRAAERIVDRLRAVDLGPKLLLKRFVDVPALADSGG
jgi:UDP-hydrolysing UDP-N-acetyl-D-glucosamine 2-epimerase